MIPKQTTFRPLIDLTPIVDELGVEIGVVYPAIVATGQELVFDNYFSGGLGKVGEALLASRSRRHDVVDIAPIDTAPNFFTGEAHLDAFDFFESYVSFLGGYIYAYWIDFYSYFWFVDNFETLTGEYLDFRSVDFFRNAEITGGYDFFSREQVEFPPDIVLPIKPIWISPELGATDVNNDTSYNWQLDPNAIRYRLQLSLSENFVEPHVIDIFVDMPPTTIEGLEYSTKYYARVAGENATGLGPWSNVIAFETIADPDTPPIETQVPEKVVVTFPVNLQEGIVQPIPVAWQAAARANDYQLQVSATMNFGQAFNLSVITKELGFSVSGLDQGEVFYLRVRARNSVGNGPWSDVIAFSTYSDVIEPPPVYDPPVIVTQTLPVLKAGIPFQIPIVVTSGSGTYTMNLIGEPDTVGKQGLTIIGTYEEAGSYTLEVRIIDTISGLRAIKVYGVTVEAPLEPLGITDITIPSATQGIAYSHKMTATGGNLSLDDYEWTLTGSLPTGISMSINGLISGTTTQDGSFSITLTVSDGSGNTATKSYDFVVNETTNLPVINAASPPSVLVGANYSFEIPISGGFPPYGLSVSSGALPPGIEAVLNTAQNRIVLSGKPTVAGTYNFTFRLTDSLLNFGTRSFSITVNPVVGGYDIVVARVRQLMVYNGQNLAGKKILVQSGVDTSLRDGSSVTLTFFGTAANRVRVDFEAGWQLNGQGIPKGQTRDLWLNTSYVDYHGGESFECPNFGIAFANARFNRVYDYYAHDNWKSGVYLWNNATDNQFYDVRSNGNYHHILRNGVNDSDADGFTIQVPSAQRNKFYRCRAEFNNDDGFDVWRSTDTYFEDCIAGKSGKAPKAASPGNGDGFKLGSEPADGGGGHSALRCKAYDCKGFGFQNYKGNLRNTSIDGCKAWTNDAGNYIMKTGDSIKSCYSSEPGNPDSYNNGTTSTHPGVSVIPSSQFISLDPNNANFLEVTTTPPGGTTFITTFSKDNSIFINPERGRHENLRGRAQTFTNLRSAGISLCHYYVELAEFFNSDISQAAINQINQSFNNARTQGIKLHVRFFYHWGYQPSRANEPSIGRCLAHIDQLAPIVGAHADVIATIWAGFVGAWGEWHNHIASTVDGGLSTQTNKDLIFNKLLDVFPASRQICFREPGQIMHIYPTVISAANAYNGSKQARAAHHNDCWNRDATDVGTWTPFNNPANWEIQKNYIEALTNYAWMTGEACNPNNQQWGSAQQTCANSLAYAARMHMCGLNRSDWAGLWTYFQNNGCFTDFERQWGYRYWYSEIEINKQGTRGSNISLRIDFENDGWARMHNTRTLYLVLRRTSDRVETRIALNFPTRIQLALPGKKASTTVTFTVPLPASMPVGDHDTFLWFPDESASIRNRVEYAVRFASLGVWEANTGYNSLRTRINIV